MWPDLDSSCITIHAVLVSVAGKGVLIRGDSGTGKSRLALALLARGHQLVADDSVLLSIRDGQLWGQAPEATNGLIDLKGAGTLCVLSAFGPSAVQDESQISLCLTLTRDRLGLMADSNELPMDYRFSGGNVRTLAIDIGDGWPEAELIERYLQRWAESSLEKAISTWVPDGSRPI